MEVKLGDPDYSIIFGISLRKDFIELAGLVPKSFHHRAQIIREVDPLDDSIQVWLLEMLVIRMQEFVDDVDLLVHKSYEDEVTVFELHGTLSSDIGFIRVVIIRCNQHLVAFIYPSIEMTDVPTPTVETLFSPWFFN